MKSIFECLRRYVARFTRRSRDSEPGERRLTEEERGIRTAPQDAYAEMRKALALTMLLG